MIRRVKRNILKSKLGTNKIKGIWRKPQIKKYGVNNWIKMYKHCVKDVMVKRAL